MIAVDTSVLIGLLRGLDTAPVRRLVDIEALDTPFRIPVPCYQEVLQGAKDEGEWARLDRYLGTQRMLLSQDPVTMHRSAARIYFDCRRRGITVRSSIDCIIAQLVLDAGDVLLHDDEDFERIRVARPELRLLRG